MATPEAFARDPGRFAAFSLQAPEALGPGWQWFSVQGITEAFQQTAKRAGVNIEILPGDGEGFTPEAVTRLQRPGVVETDVPETADSAFAGKPLVMHVRECGRDTARVPFHVGDDRSRTWVLTRTATGLRLKHDHRHADGTPDATTMYGGDTASAGTVERQEFPVDAESQALFTREGRTVSNTNTWAMEIRPGRSFVYELARPGRLFRVEFDLTRPIAAPPAPCGVKKCAGSGEPSGGTPRAKPLV